MEALLEVVFSIRVKQATNNIFCSFNMFKYVSLLQLSTSSCSQLVLLPLPPSSFVLQFILAVCCLASAAAAPGYLGGLAAPALPLAAAPAISYGHSLAAPSLASYGLAHGPALAAPAYSSISLAPRISYAAPALAHAPLSLGHAPLGLAHAPLGLGLAHAPLAAPLGLGIKSYGSPALGLGLGHGW